jgi:hypothetical protein
MKTGRRLGSKTVRTKPGFRTQWSGSNEGGGHRTPQIHDPSRVAGVWAPLHRSRTCKLSTDPFFLDKVGHRGPLSQSGQGARVVGR